MVNERIVAQEPESEAWNTRHGGAETQDPIHDSPQEVNATSALSSGSPISTDEKSEPLCESLAKKLMQRIYCSSYLCHEDIHESRDNGPLFLQWIKALRASGESILVEDELDRHVDNEEVLHLLEKGWLLHIPTHTLLRGRPRQEMKKEKITPS